MKNMVFIILCKSLDGVFAFVLYDRKLNKVFVSRDPYGVRPLFIGYTKEDELLICSEMKPISHLCKIEVFKPGHYTCIDDDLKICYHEYHNFDFTFNKTF